MTTINGQRKFQGLHNMNNWPWADFSNSHRVAPILYSIFGVARWLIEIEEILILESMQCKPRHPGCVVGFPHEI